MQEVHIGGNCNELTDVEIQKVKPPLWPLRPIENEVVIELQRSIESSGLLQPLVVRKCGDEFELVFGSHRLEACRRLGMKMVTAMIMNFSDEEAFLARISENLLRNSYVDPLEEARGYRMLVDRGWTINAIGRKVGKSAGYICERLAFFEGLSLGLRSKVSNGILKPSHAELLSRIKDKGKQNELADLVLKKHLSVRSLEAILNGAPLPTRIQIDMNGRDYFIRIPSEFVKPLGLQARTHLLIYLRGNKMVLESAECSKRRTRARFVDECYPASPPLVSG